MRTTYLSSVVKKHPLSHKFHILFSKFTKGAYFSLAVSDFVYSEGDSFLNFGLTNEERAVKYKRHTKEACRPNCFKHRSEHGLINPILFIKNQFPREQMYNTKQKNFRVYSLCIQSLTC